MAKKIIVVGAGAAGLMAAGRAAEMGAHVILLEKMREAGKKILISGKSRCNITNTAALPEFLTYYGKNGNFLRNAYSRFFRDELLALLARYGVLTQEERGGRVFPASEQAIDVRDGLLRYVEANGVDIRYLHEVQRIQEVNGIIQGIDLWNGERIDADAVILTTGGASWASTGSTGDGYVMAQSLGHTLVPLRPSLVPLTVEERKTAQALQGVSLKNVSCTFTTISKRGKVSPIRPVYPVPATGEMLFTHFGVSGPLILTMSLGIVDTLRSGKTVKLSIDIKPGMTENDINQRLQREFEHYAHRRLHTLLKSWVPDKLANVIAELSGIEEDRHVHRIQAHERQSIAKLLKAFTWTIKGTLPLSAGMVTAGGISLKEINPITFESRIVSGLYCAGEILDLAADTGGFNLQAAFTGGYLAGESAATKEA
ncbi:MAG: NAD(P)/FAD-dependent oxidoreductase [Anaerolineae bacterium]|nr:NAD(P)/FAD-dependent oxidoreductase [Anaerolineae bacterium]